MYTNYHKRIYDYVYWQMFMLCALKQKKGTRPVIESAKEFDKYTSLFNTL